jgi:gamma-glutamyltranspeptidase/glutathione hydrolase
MTGHAKGIVATGHPLVSGAAVEILAAGGNAFDAAVAAGFASAVAEPALTSLGGGGFLLARTSGNDAASEEILFDFFVDTPGLGLQAGLLEPHFFPVIVHFPASDQIFNVGLGSVAVPGNLKGFLHVHDRLGRLPLQKVIAPARRLAADGLILNHSQAYFLNLLQPIMTLSPTGRDLYITKSGRYVTSGDRIVNAELADFLDELPTDRGEDFYHGELAGCMDRDMRQGSGLLTAEDLARYQVIERRPLAIPYRDAILFSNPPPAMGGSLVGLALSILASLPLAQMTWGSPEHITTLARMLVEVEQRRARAATADCGGNEDSLPKSFSRGTTQISIADREGNVASMTISNGEGSGYYVPGTGIMLNNMMGEDDLHPEGFHACPAGQRVASMMSPSILVREDRVQLVIGSGGSKRIRTAILQVLSNIVDFDIPVSAGVEMPRIHWDGDTLQIEPGLPAATLAALSRKWPVNIWQERNMYFGGVHTVVPGRGGGGDPRRGGAVALEED